MPSSPPRSKKITIDISRLLYDKAAELVAGRRITTSIFVREAMERYLDAISREKLERELREGYLAHAAISGEVLATSSMQTPNWTNAHRPDSARRCDRGQSRPDRRNRN